MKVVAAEDADATTDPHVTLAHSVSSTDDSDYAALADQTVHGEHHRERRGRGEHQPHNPDGD